MAETNAQRAKFQSPGHYTKGDREKIDEGDFAGPHKSFPIVTQQDVHDAAHLVGHAADPAAVKAKIKSIAKKKGFSLPDAWANEDGEPAPDDNEEGRFESALVTRMLGEEPQGVFAANITRVDPERRLVEITATSEDLDSFGTRFDYDASKNAFAQWIGNVREMHQPRAVGTRFAVHCDDEARRISCIARISKGAEDTWQKILDGTLKGASIGASDVMWEHRREGDKVVPVAKSYRLVELSLVDNPSNPAARGIEIVRNALPVDSVLDTLEDTNRGMPGGEGDGSPLVIMIEAPMGPGGTAHPTGDQSVAPSEHDLLANDTDVDPDNQANIFGENPDDSKSQLTTSLRPSSLTGAASVPAGSEMDEPFRHMDGPPEDPSASTFAATRPQGVLGSEVRDGGGSGRDLGSRVAAMAQGATNPGMAAPGEVRSMTASEVMRAATQSGAAALSPFGMGATLPQGVGQLTTRRQQQAERNALKAYRQREVQHAGDEAERNAKAQRGDWDPKSGMTYDVWYRNIAEARGQAERKVMERHQAEDYAARMAAEGIDPRGIQTPQQKRLAQMNEVYARQSGAAQVTRAEEPSPSAPVTSVDQVPSSWREQIAREYLASQGKTTATRDMSGAGAPPSGQMSNSAISQTAAPADQTTDQYAGGEGAPGSDNPATNVAVVKPKGAAPRSEKHADVTDGEHSHTRTDGTVVTHSHPFMDANHDHVFRNGEPMDAALATADTTRARVSAPMVNLANPVNPQMLHPVTGSAQSAVNGKPQSPQLNAQMSNVGHLDLLNTEDAEATDFGVPGETIVPPTPGNGEVAPPAGFHTGGHTEGAIAHIEPLSPHNYDVASDLGGQHMGGVGGKMDDDLDYDGDDDERERAHALMGGRADEADETRVGARVSGESQVALHAIRDTQESGLKGVCAHCGCDECSAKLDALAHAQKTIGQLSGDPGAAIKGERSETALFAQQRILEATITRSLASLQEQIQTAVAAALAPALASAFAELETRMSDLEMTLTDSSQTTRAIVLADVTRSVEAALARDLAPLSNLPQMSQQMTQIAEVASGTQASVVSIGESVTRIEQQPAAMANPPQAYGFPRGLNLNQPGAMANLSDTDRDALVRGLQAAARQTTDVNEQARLAALVMQVQPNPRSMLGR